MKKTLSQISKVMMVSLAMVAGGEATASTVPEGTGGIQYPGGTSPDPEPPNLKPLPTKARLLKSGQASVPSGAPAQVQAVIKAGNQIVGKPYLYGGGHSSFKSSGYDCSGSVSYALHGGKLLSRPMPSGPLMSWGKSGKGDWITVYANSGHAYMQVAGLRLDTSAAGDPGGGKGPRWRKVLRSSSGYVARHPKGL
jgi:cell wall-associated NlpC family hydrolase